MNNQITQEIQTQETQPPLDFTNLDFSLPDNSINTTKQIGAFIVTTHRAYAGLILEKYIGNNEIVKIPIGIRMIGRNCFYDNYKLKKVVIPDSVDCIESSAFCKCVNLEKINLPKNLEIIPFNCFYSCANLKHLELNENLRMIGEKAFYLSGLETIKINNNLEIIDKYAFVHSKLKGINLPSSLKEIKKDVFFSCLHLKKIEYIKPTGENAHKLKLYKNNWRSVELGMTVDFLDEVSPDFLELISQKERDRMIECQFERWNELSRKIKNNLLTQFKSKKKVRQFAFKSNVTEAISECLNYCKRIKLSELDDYLEYAIEQENTEIIAMLLDYKNRYYKKDKLDEYEERKELIEMGFEYPTLTELRKNWRASVSEKGVTISGYRGKDKKAVVPDYIASGKPIIAMCNHTDDFLKMKDVYGILEEVVIGGNVEIIEESTFKNSRIKKITIPENVKRIGTRAFANSELEEINLHDDVEFLGGEIFRSTNIEKIILPSNMTVLPNRTFMDCCNLKEIILPDKLKYLESGSFLGCTSLTYVELPTDLNSIDDYVFGCCYNLTCIKLSEGIENIKYNAFADTRIENLYVPNSIKSFSNKAFGVKLNGSKKTIKKISVPSQAFNYEEKIRLIEAYGESVMEFRD